MPRTPSTHSSSNAAPVRTAQRVRPPRSGGAGGRDADRRDDGWGPHGTPPDTSEGMLLPALLYHTLPGTGMPLLKTYVNLMLAPAGASIKLT